MILLGLLSAALAAAILGAGTVVVAFVVRAMPAASLLIALLTYALELVALTALLAGLTQSSLVTTHGDDVACGVGVIAVALIWTVISVWVGTRRRIPAFDDTSPSGR